MIRENEFNHRTGSIEIFLVCLFVNIECRNKLYCASNKNIIGRLNQVEGLSI